MTKILLFAIFFPVMLIVTPALFLWEFLVTLFYLPVILIDAINRYMGEEGAGNG